MGRHKKRLIISKPVARIIDIISLLLDCHPAGYLVLCGRADWPDDEEVAEMLRLRNGSSEPVHVQGGPEIPEAQRRVEAMEGARRYMSVLDRYGGVPALIEAVNDYRRHDPQRSELLKRIGMAGMPGAKSLEAIAGENYISYPTLMRWRYEIVKDIAYLVAFRDESFDLSA